MKSKKTFWIVITIIISIIILVFIVKAIFSNYTLNEGKYRVSDAIITSTAYFEDTSDITGEWTYDISQSNVLTLLISAPVDSVISEAYISDYSSTNSSVVLCQENAESKLTTGIGKNLSLETNLDEDGNLKLNISIYNENIVTNFKVDDYTNSLVKDATVFGLIGKTIDDIKFEVKFNINIVDKTGRKSVLKIKLSLPDESMLENGTYVERLDISNLNFKI